jgi:chromosome segregation ATPase
MSAPDPLQALQAALARLDHTESNAALVAVRAELAAVENRIAETQAEANRLAGEIRDYKGPEPSAVAHRILAGAELADAVFASPPLAELQERREALLAALPTLRATADQLRIDVAQAEGDALRPIGKALKPYVDTLRDRQQAAAETILEADAELHAIARGLRVHVDHLRASERATEGLTGADSLLGWRDAFPVPQSLLSALQPLADANEAVRGIPTSIPLR